jgi:hypothetical protein
MTIFEVDSDRLRAEAERILAQPKYRTETTISERFNSWLSNLWYRFIEFLESVSGLVGGPVVLSIIVLASVVLVSVLITRNLGTRRVREIEERIRREHALARGVDPGELEEAAEAAAARGDHAGAVRLRFRAGLLRLDEQDLIRFEPGLTSAEIEALLQSPIFESLADRFDQIVYGHQTATADDYETATEGWAALLARPVGTGPG